jgi:AraC-like DNA-binding protein
VELLSKELNYSTRQFYRKLKSITEQSPAEIIREYRMHYVERLLQSTNFTVEEIMYRTGFSNRSTFYKLFAQCFGVTPRQYREQKRNAVKEEIEKG